jgi:hypothetical protein
MAKTPEEARPILVKKLGGSVDVPTAMSWFPAAPRHVVPDLLEKLVEEGVLERGVASYRTKAKSGI